jgi:hypothetical protein
MKHQQYENWILMDDQLDQSKVRELHNHLKDCSQCSALYQANQQLTHLFNTAPEPAPEPEFSARWLERVDQVEHHRNRLILFGTLGAIAMATLILVASVGLELRSAVDTFPQMLLELTNLIASWVIFLNQISNIITPLVRVSAKLLSPLWLYIAVFGLSGITTAWTIAFYRSRDLQKELGK